MLSKQSKYAVRAILYLAIYANKTNKLGSKIVAETIDVPAPFLAKILQTLARADLIRSSKGPSGGFYLSENDLSNNLLDIIECIDGLESFRSCYVGLPKCSDENPCAIHHIAAPCRDILIKELTDRTIERFAEDTKKGKSFIYLK